MVYNRLLGIHVSAMVPRLKTAQVGPLLELERRFLDRMPKIERWLRTKWQEHAVPFYATCIPDLDGPAGCPPNRFYAYGVVARLAQLAASLEIEALDAAPPAAAAAMAAAVS